MILKVILVEGLGRLRRLKPGSGVGHAGKLVAVYAENGTGKSTLVAAFRSVRTGSAAPLRERRTLAPKVDQRIHLLVDGARTLRFDGSGWDGTLPSVEIFDRAFVESTVHDGSVVSANQRQQLFHLALGEEDAACSRRVDSARAAHQAAVKELKAADGRLQQWCAGAGVGLGALEEAEPLDEAPAGHAQRESRLRALTSGGDLDSLPRPGSIPEVRALDAGRLRSLLDEAAASIPAEAVEAIRRHVAERLGEDGERWLREGASHAGESKHCPYCRQDLAQSEFAAQLQGYFNVAYADQQRRLSQALDAVARWDDWLAALQAREVEAERARGAWSSYLEIAAPPPLDHVKSNARSFIATLRQLLGDKLGRPLEPLGHDERVDVLASAHAAVQEGVEAYVTWMKNLDERIAPLLASRDEELAHLRAVVSSVQARLLRGRQRVQDDLAERDHCQAAVAAALAEIREAEEELSKLETLRTGGFLTRVNDVLKDFGAGFRVRDLEGKASSTRVIADFQIELVSGGKVKASATSADAPRFATVLSDGDRTTLALAIFVARCEADGHSGKVIVLDDPISSLDTLRRRATMTVLRRLEERHAQIWVLSHDEHFLHDALSGNVTWLRLRHRQDDAELVVWDPEEHCKPIYWQDFARLEAFRDRAADAPDARAAWRTIRPVLEHYLRHRFPKAWRPKEWLGDFFRKARERHPAIRLEHAAMARLESWCGLSNPGMHGNPQDASPPPSEEEIRLAVTEVLDFIQS